MRFINVATEIFSHFGQISAKKKKKKKKANSVNMNLQHEFFKFLVQGKRKREKKSFPLRIFF